MARASDPAFPIGNGDGEGESRLAKEPIARQSPERSRPELSKAPRIPKICSRLLFLEIALETKKRERSRLMNGQSWEPGSPSPTTKLGESTLPLAFGQTHFRSFRPPAPLPNFCHSFMFWIRFEGLDCSRG